MSWLKLDDGFAEHAKVLALSDAAFRLHMCALCWVARQETDGALPLAAQRALRAKPKLVDELVASGLWEPTDSGHTIHDYLDYNPSKAKLDAERAVTKARVQRFRNAVTDPQSGAHRIAPVTPLQQRDTESCNAVSNGAPVPSRPVPSPNQDQIPPSPPVGGKPAKPAKPRRVLLEVSEWPGPTEAHRALAKECRVNVEREATAMRDWARSKGDRKVDWNAAFNGWLRRAGERVGPTPPPGLVIHQAFGGRSDPIRASLEAEAASAARLKAKEAAINSDPEIRRKQAEFIANERKFAEECRAAERKVQ